MVPDLALVRLRLINKKELRLLVGFSDMHILRLEKVGKFPRRIQLADNTVRWRLSEILDWIEARAAVMPNAHRPSDRDDVVDKQVV